MRLSDKTTWLCVRAWRLCETTVPDGILRTFALLSFSGGQDEGRRTGEQARMRGGGRGGGRSLARPAAVVITGRSATRLCPKWRGTGGQCSRQLQQEGRGPIALGGCPLSSGPGLRCGPCQLRCPGRTLRLPYSPPARTSVHSPPRPVWS